VANAVRSLTHALRFLAALALALVAAGAMAVRIGDSFIPNLFIWLALAAAIGLVLARWWALLFAPIPWSILIGVGFFTGRIAFFGEAWWAIALATVLFGLMGIALGVLLAQVLAAWLARSRAAR
jgi:hypothetical protein